MTKLSLMDAEARAVAGRLSEQRLKSTGESLQALCVAHWLELRGPVPSTCLASAVWNAPPPVADLFASRCAVGDPRIVGALGRLSPAQGLAVLVLAEIEQGDGLEARAAYEAMKLFGMRGVGEAHARRVRDRLSERGRRGHPLHLHSSRAPIWKALAAITAEMGRCDPNAAVAAINLLARLQAGSMDAGEDEGARRPRGLKYRTIPGHEATLLSGKRGRSVASRLGVRRHAKVSAP